MSETRILIAQITAPQGLDGSVRIRAFTDDPANLKRYKKFQTARGELTLKNLRAQPNALVAKFVEITDRTAAETWRGVELQVARERLSATTDAEYYQSDLVGMVAVSTTGEAVGTVTAIENYGAGDLLDVALASGGSRLFPFADIAVDRVDTASRTIILHSDYLAE